MEPVEKELHDLALWVDAVLLSKLYQATLNQQDPETLASVRDCIARCHELLKPILPPDRVL